ncbi:RHS repeat-associated protein [Tenacibaculum skagerrakense]|uniref:RHS repeat-associated protein n=1 Tax=Tenacibaculum skagerrakense TaxID=186571 RepID=A0A4R2NUS4_9FLAO|nr:peptidoglycan DD-metalloendopeptidase family protein [Tenacibaculum skagerrakense]TCP25125.1 RHS repeat-associated protein [Tenacibaculum skagerrakense]
MNIATSNTFTKHVMWSFKTAIVLAVFFVATFFTHPLFAQEKEVLKETTKTEKVEAISEEEISKEEVSISEEVKPIEVELSKEQLTQIAELDELLKAEKISQEEYDKKKAEIIGVKPVEEKALAARSAQVEPEAQTLGKYIAPTVSTTNGSLNYSYPIVVPPGRNGLTPDIALTYNSTNKSQSSLVGTGWSFNIPYIQRVNKKGTDKLYTEDYFISSLDGELIDQGNGIYTPRTENGSFLKYEYSNDTWTVTDKTGTTYEFGATVAARQDNPNDSTQIFSWMLETVTDTNSNTISYSYFKDQGQIYPDTISYNQSGLFNVVFNRMARTNPYTANSSAFDVNTAYLINEVEVLIDNSAAFTYEISTTDNLVNDITVTGFAGTNTFELPPVEFEYNSETADKSFTHIQDWDFPTRPNSTILAGCVNSNNIIIDVNGDSLADCISSNDTSSITTNWVAINNGNGWDLDLSWDLPKNYNNSEYLDLTYSGSSDYSTFGDVNGDGLPDVIASKGGSDLNQRYNRVYINNGNGWDLDLSYELPKISATTYYRCVYNETRMIDLNGDGLIDCVKSEGGSNADKVYLNNGDKTWSLKSDWQFPLKPGTSTKRGCTNTNNSLVDVNGDGLVDCIATNDNNYANSNWIAINNGNGWVSNTSWEIPKNYNGSEYLDLNYDESTDYSTFAEVNGDNLIDIVASAGGSSQYYNRAFINKGNGWDLDLSYELPKVNSSSPSQYYECVGSKELIIDLDGDGLSDCVYSEGGSHYDRVYLSNHDTFGNISKLTNSHQGETDFEYSHVKHQDNSNHIHFPVEVIESIATDDNNGNTATTSYEYRDAEYYFNTPHDKKFTGFGEVIKTTDDGTIHTAKYHQANGETGNEPTDSYTKIGKVFEQTIEDSSNNLFSRTRTEYIETALGNDAYSIQKESELSMQYDGASSHTDTATEYEYDSYGNIEKQTQYGEVDGNIDGTFTDTGSDKRTVEYTYTNDTANYIVGLPTNQTLKNNSGTKEAETNYNYDTSGNLLTESKWISGSDYSDTIYTYNGYGLPLTETDALSNTTTYAYDTENMYPSSVVNALSQVTSYLYDYSSGKVTQITEPNGKVTGYDYDGLDRLIEIVGTVGNGATEVLKDISYNTTASPQYSKSTTYTGTEFQDVYTYTDGFGKTIQTKSEMDNDWLTLDTVYDDMGRVEKQSLPYETSSSSNSNPTSNNDLLTSFTYDALGRVLSTSNTKGTTTTDYDGFETAIVDAENNEKDLITDAFGNLVTVKEYNAGSIYTTNYDYNAQNLLTKITDAESNVRNIDYDGLGRRTSLEDLHNSSDTTFGTWNFNYDDINLISQTDPNGTTTSYTYDDLNRVVTENNSGIAGVDVTYTYDSCTNGTGYLCSVITPDVTTNHTYLKQGLVDTTSRTIDGTSYTTNTDYDRQGNVTKVTHPNASYTEYGHNTRGLVDEVKYNGTSLVTADYGVHGRLTSYTHANGVSSTLIYDENELYELTSKVTTDGTTDFQNLSYSYDNVGNITQIIDISNTDTAKTQSFNYDDLYRLTGTTVTGSANTADYTRSYSYSPIGNITAFDGVNYSYTDTGYSNPHAVTNIGGTSYSYDNNGNLTTDGTWTHSWDYRNRLTSSSDGTATSSYEYDSNNQRIKLVEGSDTTIYPTGDYEIKNGDIKVSLSLGESLVATDDNGTINHVHTDHLGGTNITTDTTGTITQTLDYYPYGDTRIDTGTDNETKQFTGYVKDSSTGLNYAGQRYYAGNIGRFISQDPVALFDPGAFLSDPQQLNSYTYARNNPVIFVDPNGESALLASALMITSMLISPRTANTPSESSYTMYASPIGPQQQRNTALDSPVGNIRISSGYLDDRSGCDKCSNTHGGTDYATPIGTPIKATANGEVARSSWSNSYGNVVILNHGESSIQNEQVFTLYGHGSERLVNKGDSVSIGDTIMSSGNTGNSTGPHLHYEVISSPYDPNTSPSEFYGKDKYDHRYSPKSLSNLTSGQKKKQESNKD